MTKMTTMLLAAVSTVLSMSQAYAAPFPLVSSSGDLVVEVRDDNGALNAAAYQGIEYFRHGADALLFVNGWSVLSDQPGPFFISYANNNMRGDADIPMTVSSDGTTITAVGTYFVDSVFLIPVEVQITRTYTLVSDSVLRVSTTFENLLPMATDLRFANSYRAVQGIDVPGNGFSGKFSDVVDADVDGTIVPVATASASDNPFSTGNPVDTVAVGSLDSNAVVEGGGSTIFTHFNVADFLDSPQDDNGQFNFDNTNVGCDIALGASGSGTESFTFTFDMSFGKTPDDAVQNFIDANVEPVIEVEIDVKPGSDENPLNLKSQGLLPVAVLTTEEFDAQTVDPETAMLVDPEILVSPTTATKSAVEDVDEDGDLDLLLFFDVADLVDNGSVDEQTAFVTLLAEDTDGAALIGMDLVTIKPPKK